MPISVIPSFLTYPASVKGARALSSARYENDFIVFNNAERIPIRKLYTEMKQTAGLDE
jgi:hypothetical protein